MKNKIQYQFSNKLWKDSFNGWYFVTFPKKYSQEIRSNLQWQEEGWGRMKAIAIIQDLKWDTSIWFDSKNSKCYVLPLKSEIRKKLAMEIGDLLEVCVFV